VGGQLWLHFNGKTICIEESRGGGRVSGGSNEISNGEVFSPMPGKILKVNVAKGDSVASEQVLIVMEAMKMEYSLSAGVAGKVISVDCKPGDQVLKDRLLVKVQA
jgi:3-methylcrotonyl-CoA carboxylase alpha subunit